MSRAARTTRRALPLLLCAGLGLAASGCGGSADDDFAAGWDGVCTEISDAYKTFRTDVVSTATSSPDLGDESAAKPLPASVAAVDLARPARKLERNLRAPLRTARTLDPPSHWRTWHQQAHRALSAQARVVFTGVREVEAGEADRLASLALGGFGPAAGNAPPALRDQTPACTALR